MPWKTVAVILLGATVAVVVAAGVVALGPDRAPAPPAPIVLTPTTDPGRPPRSTDGTGPLVDEPEGLPATTAPAPDGGTVSIPPAPSPTPTRPPSPPTASAVPAPPPIELDDDPAGGPDDGEEREVEEREVEEDDDGGEAEEDDLGERDDIADDG